MDRVSQLRRKLSLYVYMYAQGERLRFHAESGSIIDPWAGVRVVWV